MPEAGVLQIRMLDLPAVRKTVHDMRDHIHLQHAALKRAEALMTKADSHRVADGLPCPCCGSLTYWEHLNGCNYMTTLSTIQTALRPTKTEN